MSIRLSKRLQAVADAVPRGARLIDVGTDHAMIPVWLSQNDRVSHVWASDIRPGPLESARRLIGETGCGERISLRLTDGLNGFGPEDGDTVTIAGMGGETMVHILQQALWTRENTLLILEPQSKQAFLRRWLLDNDYAIQQECLVEDAGRIYPILVATGGIGKPHTPVELHLGRMELIGSDPLLPAYLDALMRRIAPAVEHDEESAALMAEFNSLKERLKECRK